MMKSTHRPGYRYSPSGCPGRMERSKIRLELFDGLQGCTPSFFISRGCVINLLPGLRFSDKMQTKTAQKETQDSHPRSLKSLYNGGVSTSIAKVVISFEKSNIECVIDPLINQPPNSDMLLLCHCFESVPGLPVNGDDHLHPLVLRICRFPTTPRSCTSPCFLCHLQSSWFSWRIHSNAAIAQSTWVDAVPFP